MYHLLKAQLSDGFLLYPTYECFELHWIHTHMNLKTALTYILFNLTVTRHIINSLPKLLSLNNFPKGIQEKYCERVNTYS